MSQKEKFALYLTPEMKARLERRYTEDGSRSLTGFIENPLFISQAVLCVTIGLSKPQFKKLRTVQTSLPVSALICFKRLWIGVFPLRQGAMQERLHFSRIFHRERIKNSYGMY